MEERVPIVRRKLFEQVAAHLEGEIIAGRLKPGDRLPAERDLQAIYGVGRPAIREALIALHRAGFLEVANGTPARVATPKAKDLLAGMMPAVRQILSTDQGQKEFQDVRTFFECSLARHAARIATPDDCRLLEQALEANHDALGDIDRFVESDINFHLVIAKISGNSVIVALHDALAGWLRQQRITTLQSEGMDRAAYEAHRNIFEAIRAGDPDRAEMAMKDHLAGVAYEFWLGRKGSPLGGSTR